jgi:hypothetical protein
MHRDIDDVIEALRAAYPDITVAPLRGAHPGADDDGRWFVRHPAALSEVQLESSAGTGRAPFLVESDLAPPARARTAEEAVALVIARLGVSLAAG